MAAATRVRLSPSTAGGGGAGRGRSRRNTPHRRDARDGERHAARARGRLRADRGTSGTTTGGRATVAIPSLRCTTQRLPHKTPTLQDAGTTARCVEAIRATGAGRRTRNRRPASDADGRRHHQRSFARCRWRRARCVACKTPCATENARDVGTTKRHGTRLPILRSAATRCKCRNRGRRSFRARARPARPSRSAHQIFSFHCCTNARVAHEPAQPNENAFCCTAAYG